MTEDRSDMPNNYRYLELLSRKPVSRVRLLDHGPFSAEEIAELTTEWHSKPTGRIVKRCSWIVRTSNS